MFRKPFSFSNIFITGHFGHLFDLPTIVVFGFFVLSLFLFVFLFYLLRTENTEKTHLIKTTTKGDLSYVVLAITTHPATCEYEDIADLVVILIFPFLSLISITLCF